MRKPINLFLKISIAFVVIVINSMLVLFLAKDQLAIPSLLSPLHEQTGRPNTSDEPAAVNDADKESPTIMPAYSSKLAKANNNSNLELPSVNEHHTAKCLDKKPPPEKKVLYTWFDGKGVKHISDKPRRVSADTSVKVVAEIQPEAIAINFLSHDLTTSVREKFNSQVKKAMDAFASVTPEDAIVPVAANLRSFSDKARFLEYYKQSGSSVSSATGFYSAAKNESVVLVRNTEQTTRTVVHELMHTVNRHWYGQMAKWLNEGMAEYAETTENIRDNVWIGHLKTRQPLSLMQLFNASREDWQQNSQDYYATSWAFVAFLMLEDKDFMSRLLLKESDNGCKELSSFDVENIFGKDLEYLDSVFRHWVTTNLS